MCDTPISVYGYGGDALTAPEHTLVAFWAALGGGADGIVTGVRRSREGVVVCSNHDDFGPTCGDNRKVTDLNWRDIRSLDAGFTFRSTVLNAENQPTGKLGQDRPWRENLPSKRAVRVPRLSEVLILFARRCRMMVLLPEGDSELADATLAELRRYGVLNRVLLAGSKETCKHLATKASKARRVLLGKSSDAPINQLALADELGAEALYLDWDAACPSSSDGLVFNPDLRNGMAASSVQLFLGSENMPYAPTPAHSKAIRGLHGIAGIIARGVLQAVAASTPPALIAEDAFKGTRIDRSLWSAGYSHANQDTEIFQDDSLHIKIKAGGSYSGAAAVCVVPVHGRFDAWAEFHVSNPKQATTFELAAICIEPGYFHIDNSNLNSRNVNLTFDVHGAPPYASSERDEDNGFRCGWNNGFNLTRIDSEWNASSVNMYNKYGRDVGHGKASNPKGRLRLVRNGQVFACYYTDRYNAAWVCSGAMLVQNMSEDVYLRLAAKHWAKAGTPPENHVRFSRFMLYQF